MRSKLAFYAKFNYTEKHLLSVLDLRFSTRLHEGKPALSEVKRSLRVTRKFSWIGNMCNIIWFLFIWPTIIMSTSLVDFHRFIIWVS